MSGDSAAVLEREVVPNNRISANATRFEDRDIIPVVPVNVAPVLPRINLAFGNGARLCKVNVTFLPPYSKHRMEMVEFGYDETLQKFVNEKHELIKMPGLDGFPFAPHAGNGVFQSGLALCYNGHGFLQSLMAVVQDCRMAQFPWLKDILPEKTYQQLSYLQIPRRPVVRSPMCGLE